MRGLILPEVQNAFREHEILCAGLLLPKSDSTIGQLKQCYAVVELRVNAPMDKCRAEECETLS